MNVFFVTSRTSFHKLDQWTKATIKMSSPEPVLLVNCRTVLMMRDGEVPVITSDVPVSQSRYAKKD